RSVTKCASFDHLVGARDHSRRDSDAERIGGFEGDRQFKFARLFNRDVGDLDAAERLNKLTCIEITDEFGETRPIRRKSPLLRPTRAIKKLPVSATRRHVVK